MNRLLLALACLALLAACAPAPVRTTGVVDAQHFQLDGRLSVRQGDMRHHVGIRWRHAGPRDEILLTGPLGQGLAELTRDAAGARLTTPDRKSLAADDWESLAERAFGVRLPLSDMPRWVVGVSPVPQGFPPVTLTIDGWRIDYLEYENGLPVLMELRHGDIEVRLKVDVWSAP